MAKLKTGRHTSVLKEERKTVKRTFFNRNIKKEIKGIIKKIERAVQEKKKEEALGLLKKSFSIIDKAAKRNILHKNNASRKKARLSRLTAKISA